MKKSPEFSWDAETGLAACFMYNSFRNKNIISTAQCAPEDEDMKSEKTGCTIASLRALIELLRQQRDDTKMQLKGLNIYYNTINHSKQFDPNSCPVRRLMKHMEFLRNNLTDINTLIDETQKELTSYIHDKDEFYKRIRKNRKDKNNQ